MNFKSTLSKNEQLKFINALTEDFWDNLNLLDYTNIGE